MQPWSWMWQAAQHAVGYQWLTMRSKRFLCERHRHMQWILIGGILLMNSFPQLLLIGIVLCGNNNLFISSLPVEYDASNRAWLESKKMLTQQEHDGAKDALKWAARTYVVAALGSTLLYYVSIYMGGGSRRD
jgi:Zn-dependent membrane protease YugP